MKVQKLISPVKDILTDDISHLQTFFDQVSLHWNHENRLEKLQIFLKAITSILIL